jgi:hypothetical protein
MRIVYAHYKWYLNKMHLTSESSGQSLSVTFFALRSKKAAS